VSTAIHPPSDRPGLANLEAGFAAWLSSRDLDGLDHRSSGADSAPGEERLDGLVGSLEDRFHGAVPAVPYPAGDAARSRTIAGQEAERDALDAPPDDHVRPRSHTVTVVPQTIRARSAYGKREREPAEGGSLCVCV
jgi:hypothetical protein